MNYKLKNEVFWYKLLKPTINKLNSNLKANIMIIGGGIAGLSAALRLHELGEKNIVLLEKDFCGSGASGKSSGFVSPDSELQLNNFVAKFGKNKALDLWNFSESGVNYIKNNIEKYNLDCDYHIQDTLYIANSKRAVRSVQTEHKIRRELGYNIELYNNQNLNQILGSSKYYDALRSYNTFGISAYLYCQNLKEILKNLGIQVYENSAVTSISQTTIKTNNNTIKTDQIIICTDRYLPQFDIQRNNIYQAQTFLLVSQPLKDIAVNQIFPDKPLMVSDTDLVFNYYRLIKDNRLLVGGASMINSYIPYEHQNSWRVYNKLFSYIKNKFPQTKLTFEYMWPGMLGLTKDIIPIAYQDNKYQNIYAISGATGLSWATALGCYIAEKIVKKRSDLDHLLTPDRNFPVPNYIQNIIGKPAAFGLSNLITILK